LLDAIGMEIALQKNYTGEELIDTIYFGGGTPSLLSQEELQVILQQLADNFELATDAEITLEANPDDIQLEKLREWKTAGVNRLSIGVQSFFEEDLRWMNRAHNTAQAEKSLEDALTVFHNISIDLIYGTPGLSNERWKKNMEKAVSLGIPHLSCYALTVEPDTPLDKMIRENKKAPTDAELQANQFMMCMQFLEEAGYNHYEISNFSKPGLESRHNTSYWQGKKYLGLGPSAHSFNGSSRQWNISNNNIYIREIALGKLPAEKEILTGDQQLNEYIMISLRTSKGIELNKMNEAEKHLLLQKSKIYLERDLLNLLDNRLLLTKKGKLLADGIAAALFF
jgi:oxygen-independent coproporphyrinogen-3 oxidase